MIDGGYDKMTTSDPIPTDWDMVKLGDIFEPITIRLKDYDSDGLTIPILSMTRAQGLILQSEKFDKRVASRDTSNYKVVKNGQLVYSFPIDEGVIAIMHRYPMGAVSPAYQVWEPIREVDLTFIDYMLRTPMMINAYKMFSSTVVERRRNLAQRDFIRIEVPLPPLPEQRAIAQVLTIVSQSIKSTEQVITATHELKRSMMKHLFTYGPVPIDQADHVVLEETDFGDVPDSWEVLPVGSICDSIVPGRTKPKRFDGNIPWITMPDIRGRIYVDFSTSGLALSEEAIKEVKAKIISKESVIMTCVGEFGLTVIANRDIVINQQLHAFVCPEQLDSYFLSHALQLQKPYMERIAHFTTIPYMSKDKCNSVPIPIPSIEDQRVISKILKSIDMKILSEEQSKSALEAMFSSMLHHLMTGKLRVQV